MSTVTAFSTVIFFAVFVGICCWAWSRGRQDANRESAMLPFALPDEATPHMQDVRRHAGRAHAIEQEQ
ncbi:cytochrome c oxidase cbb3-type subunit 4 [Cupriavidus gilardii J11]|uniref:Cytochrome c oxidase cbb3-type subunit 4 n=1 Tax=Cupriavidus gilardii J11 TaxID=936133 RepID=A0A562B386_9BURK|nr:CcoQ/FixQ family Cbb3-type cytochrome c oxidase assembly chaperone [Cupriavidus gilardii]TWG79606.1 cytochrome c oxidase cbb3-type subunit 4 [Cupriavidus gilardii J11]